MLVPFWSKENSTVRGSELSLSKVYRQNCFDGKLDSQVCILKSLFIDKRKEMKLLSKTSEKTKGKKSSCVHPHYQSF